MWKSAKKNEREQGQSVRHWLLRWIMAAVSYDKQYSQIKIYI
jgi:hypothetical protein